MRLRDVLSKYTGGSEQAESLPIIYRTHDPYGRDILAGACRWESGELIPEDGDSYSLDDEISDYSMELEFDEEWSALSPYLVVWYESEWVCE